MKMPFHSGRVFLAAVLSLFVVSHYAANGQIPIGTGEDVSYAVIEAQQFGIPLVFAYHYTYDPAEPLDGYALLNAIDSADPALSFGFLNFGDDESPNYFLNSVTYGSTTLTSTPFPDVGPFWAQWVSGGTAGFPTAAPIELGVWTFGSGISSPYRTIEPGSSEGLVFNLGDTPPSISPVPEPQSSVLLLAGITVVLWMLRRRRHEEKRI
jgi:PEP-CTERM motif